MTTATVLPEDALERVADQLQQRTGLLFRGDRRRDLARALRRNLPAAVPPASTDWLELLAQEPARWEQFLADITIGETYFFREPQQNQVILEAVLRVAPPMVPLRCWSAGCSTGEEAYTLALLLRAAGRHEGARVLGTDLSPQALARARAARYGAWALRGMAEPLRDRWFRPVRGGFQLDPFLRDAVVFRSLNLATEHERNDFPRDMDLILCRNVLIYLAPEVIPVVAQRLFQALSPGGWLFLGSSDPMLAALAPFEVEMTAAGVAYRRPLRPAPAPQERPRLKNSGPTLRATAPRLTPTPPPPPTPVDTGPAATTPLAAQISLIRTLADRGEIQAASSACHQALDAHPLSAELHYLDALLLRAAGFDVLAFEALRRTLYLDREAVMAQLTLGTWLLRDGQPGARAALDRAETLLHALPPNVVPFGAEGQSVPRLHDLVRSQRAMLSTGAL